MVLTSLRVERGSSPQPGPSGGRCPTAAFTIMCSHCGTARTGRRNGTPWCQPCRIWLFVCELTGQWVSAAECDDRKRSARNAAIVEQTRHIATASIGQARELLPDGWQAQLTQLATGACQLSSPVGAGV